MARPGRLSPIKIIGAIGALSAAAAGSYLLYSYLRPDPNDPLPDALPATRTTFDAPTAGSLSYYSDTSGEGRPILLLHSINAAASAYEVKPLFEAYAGTRPVYALDLPGFGFSDRSQREYSVALYVAAITEFLDSEVEGPVDVVALSLTSEFAAMAAVARPDQISSVVMISPSGFRGRRIDVPDTLYEVFSSPWVGNALYDPLVTRPVINYYLQRNFVGDVPDDIIDYARLTARQPGAKNAPLYFVGGRLFSPDVRDETYTQVTQPVLVVFDEDPNLDFDALAPFVAAHPNFETARIAPSLGLPHWELLSQTAEALDRFWAERAD